PTRAWGVIEGLCGSLWPPALRTISFRFSPSPIAASRSTLRANRLGGGLPSLAGGLSSLTSTRNCRSRKARLRGAGDSDDTRRLAVASDVPFQASGGIPPCCAGRKPVTLSSKLGAWAAAVAATSSAAATARLLAREAFIGDWDLEMLQLRAGLDDRQGCQATRDQQDHEHHD